MDRTEVRMERIRGKRALRRLLDQRIRRTARVEQPAGVEVMEHERDRFGQHDEHQDVDCDQSETAAPHAGQSDSECRGESRQLPPRIEPALREAVDQYAATEGINDAAGGPYNPWVDVIGTSALVWSRLETDAPDVAPLDEADAPRLRELMEKKSTATCGDKWTTFIGYVICSLISDPSAHRIARGKRSHAPEGCLAA